MRRYFDSTKRWRASEYIKIVYRFNYESNRKVLPVIGGSHQEGGDTLSLEKGSEGGEQSYE